MGCKKQDVSKSSNMRNTYLRAKLERPSKEFVTGQRREIKIDEARNEFATAISRLLNRIFQDKYGPLLGSFSEVTITEILKEFEANLSRAKGDVTLVAQELLDRLLPPTSKKRR